MRIRLNFGKLKLARNSKLHRLRNLASQIENSDVVASKKLYYLLVWDWFVDWFDKFSHFDARNHLLQANGLIDEVVFEQINFATIRVAA